MLYGHENFTDQTILGNFSDEELQEILRRKMVNLNLPSGPTLAFNHATA
jgi:hypothetical protein